MKPSLVNSWDCRGLRLTFDDATRAIVTESLRSSVVMRAVRSAVPERCCGSRPYMPKDDKQHGHEGRGVRLA